MKRILQGVSLIVVGMLLVSSIVLSGCGTAEETTQTAAETSAMDSVKTDNQRLQAENTQLRKSNSQLEQDKKALNAKVADLTSKLGQSSQQWQDLVDLQNRVTALDSELTVQKQVNRDLMAKRADMEKESMTTGGPRTPSTVTTAAEFKRDYDQALSSFKSHKYQEAIANLENLSGSTADPKLLSNVHYWLGESYYAVKRYNDAIAEFQQTLTYPKSFKRGAAYIMLGMSYVRLGDKAKAKEAWEELVSKDPKSSYAAKAKQYLKQL